MEKQASPWLYVFCRKSYSPKKNSSGWSKLMAKPLFEGEGVGGSSALKIFNREAVIPPVSWGKMSKREVWSLSVSIDDSGNPATKGKFNLATWNKPRNDN